MNDPYRRLTKEQAVILGAVTGVMMGPFDEFHEYVERILDRPVYTHEFADARTSAEIKKAAWDDFMEIVRNGGAGMMEDLRAQLEPLWLTDLRNDETLGNVNIVHGPDRALTVTMLCCNRTVGVDEHAGGFDEMPGRPSWRTLARVLRWRIAGHECGKRLDREW